MSKFQNTIIYKLECNKTKQIYIGSTIKTLKQSNEKLTEKQADFLIELITLREKYKLAGGNQQISAILSHMISAQTDLLINEISDEITDNIKILCNIANAGKIEIEKTIPQNIVYDLIHEHKENYFSQLNKGQFKGFSLLRNLIGLGEALGIEVEQIKNRLLRS